MLIKSFFTKLTTLDKYSKSILYIKFIFIIWTIISLTFVNLYVYKIFNNSIEYLIYYNIFLYTWMFLGFSIFWYIFLTFNFNVKNLFYVSFISLFTSFLFLLFVENDILRILLFIIFNSTWTWVYYSASHAYEIKNIKAKNRDFFSSLISIWFKFLYIFIPIFISLVFYLDSLFKFDNAYTILFILLPIVYLFSIFFIKNLKPYFLASTNINTNTNISNKNILDFKRFFNKKNANIIFYFLTDSITFTIPNILIIIALINVLESEVSLWIYQSIFSLLSIILIALMSTVRNNRNRIKIMLISWIIIFMNFVILGFNLNLYGLILYYIIDSVIAPFYKISIHVYDLKFIKKIKSNNILSTMIFRELILWIWRVLAFIIILVIIKYNPNNLENILQYSFIVLAFFYILSPIFVFLEEKNNKVLN